MMMQNFTERVERGFCFNREQIVVFIVGQICFTLIILVYLQGQLSPSATTNQPYMHSTKTHRSYTDAPEVILSRDTKEYHTTEVPHNATKIDSDVTSAKTTKSEQCNCKSSESKPITHYDFLINKTELENTFSKRRRIRVASCKAIFDNDSNTIVDAQIFMEKANRKDITTADYIDFTSDCTTFIVERGYITTAITKTEKDFPLAFSILVYKDVEQFERLLRAIYRPQNVYCVHVDVKTTQDNKDAIRAIVSCFPNVFMSTRSVDVRWGEFTVLEAELVCMQDLWSYSHWKYFINLTGQEFPLKTNLELVKILETMKWANVVDGTWIRARQFYFDRWIKSNVPPPHNIRPIKGSVHVAINRDFVDFALHDYRSKDFLLWLNKTLIPDETFFSSLNHNTYLRIPGSFLGDAEEYPKKPTFTRYKNWELGHGIWARKCSGQYTRSVCVLGIGDLHRLQHDIGLFVNKFHLNSEYLALDCMEEFMFNKTRDQYLNEEHLDMSFYASLDQVRFRYIKPDQHH